MTSFIITYMKLVIRYIDECIYIYLYIDTYLHGSMASELKLQVQVHHRHFKGDIKFYQIRYYIYIKYIYNILYIYLYIK